LSTNTLRHQIGASVAVSGDPLATRRWEGGTAKQAVLTAFAAHQTTVAKAIGRGEIVETNDKNEPNLRNSYTREHKLAAVDYALYTWRINQKGEEKHISNRCAAKKLGITDVMLGRWIRNRSKISEQKKSSRRSRASGTPQEAAVEDRLSKLFDDARAKGDRLPIARLLGTQKQPTVSYILTELSRILRQDGLSTLTLSS
jgi:hypothetical protein